MRCSVKDVSNDTERSESAEVSVGARKISELFQEMISAEQEWEEEEGGEFLLYNN